MSEILSDRPEYGIFSKPLFIPFRDCDAWGRPSLSSWLSYLAELAGDQYERRNLGRDVLLSQNQVFLVSRFSLRVIRHPVNYETLTASTWEKGVDTVFFQRNYDFADETGKICAEGSSLWLLCDPVRHRILRPSALGHPVLDIDRPIGCPVPAKLLPPQNAEVLGQRKVVFTDLDANHHIYCANYGRIFMDWLPEKYQKLPYTHFTLNYVKEAMLGETLTISGLEEQDQYTIVGSHEDGGVSFIAKMTF